MIINNTDFLLNNETRFSVHQRTSPNDVTDEFYNFGVLYGDLQTLVHIPKEVL